MNSVWTEKSSFDVRFEIKNKIIHEQSELESRITHESDQSEIVIHSSPIRIKATPLYDQSKGFWVMRKEFLGFQTNFCKISVYWYTYI